jgi:hypothetical protein
MMMIDLVDMIGDTLHAGIHICPHVLWHTVNKRCNNVATTQADVKALAVIGLPGREIKVHTGKGKNPTKADLLALNGPEVSKVVAGRGVVLDAVLSPSGSQLTVPRSAPYRARHGTAMGLPAPTAWR